MSHDSQRGTCIVGHLASDGRFYVLDTARVMPPEPLSSVITAAYIPSDNQPIVPITFPRHNWFIHIQSVLGGSQISCFTTVPSSIVNNRIFSIDSLNARSSLLQVRIDIFVPYAYKRLNDNGPTFFVEFVVIPPSI